MNIHTLYIMILGVSLLAACDSGGGGNETPAPSKVLQEELIKVNSFEIVVFRDESEVQAEEGLHPLLFDLDWDVSVSETVNNLYSVTVYISRDSKLQHDIDPKIISQTCGDQELLNCSKTGELECEIYDDLSHISCKRAGVSATLANIEGYIQTLPMDATLIANFCANIGVDEECKTATVKLTIQ